MHCSLFLSLSFYLSLSFSLSLYLSFSPSFFPSLFHLFTHLLEEGHNEINISFSREKAVCLLLSFFLSYATIFHIFIIHFMKVVLREMPVRLLLSVCVCVVCLFDLVYVVASFTQIDFILTICICIIIYQTCWLLLQLSILYCNIICVCGWERFHVAEVAGRFVP